MLKKWFSRQISVLTAILMLASCLPANAAWENGTVEARTTTPDIRFAVFSDTHISEPQQIWTKADEMVPMLELYKKMDSGMDAFAMVGDIIYQTKVEESYPGMYEKVLDTIDDYFTYETSEAAVTNPEATKLIWAMGNHEISAGASTSEHAAVIAENKQQYKDAMGHNPTYKTTVNGYTFITAEPANYLNYYCNGDRNSAKTLSATEQQVMDWIEAAEAESADKPIFYLQHEPVVDTFFASWEKDSNGAVNSTEFREFLDSHPRVVVLSAHHHYPAQDVRSIWQDNFTLIHSPVVSGGNSSKYGTSDPETNNEHTSQCMMIEATGSKVEVYKMDIKSGQYIGEPYTFDVSNPSTFIYNDSRYETAKASTENKPYFAEDAEISVSDVTGHEAVISFPTATKDGESAAGLQDSFVHMYKVSVTNNATGNVVKTETLLDDYWRVEANRRTSRSIELAELSRDTEYTVSVVAESVLGQESEPLTGTFKTTKEKNEADKALTKQGELKNVALGKAIVNESGMHTTWIPANLTDGRYNTITAGTAVSAYATIDLGKRYSVEKIILHHRKDTADPSGRHHFEILGSNDPNFATSVKLGGLEAANEALFPDNGTYTVNMSGAEAYRYIRLANTNSAWSIWSELEVYAREYMTEVSRNKPVEATYSAYANNQPEKAVDGKNSNFNTEAWRSSYPDGRLNYYGETIGDYLIVDLEKEMPVSHFEMEYPNGVADNSAARRYWSVYGTNELPSMSETTPAYRTGLVGTGTEEVDIEGIELLGTTGDYFIPTYNAENPLSMHGNIAATEGYISQSVEDIQPYRFVIFKHRMNQFSELGEVRVFVTNPEFKKAVKEDNGIKLMFSEPMMAEDIIPENIKLYDTNGNAVTEFNVALSSDGFDAVITGADNIQKVIVSDSIRSALGVDIAGDTTQYIESTVSYEGMAKSVKYDVNVAQYKPVTVITPNGEDNTDSDYPAENMTDGIIYGSYHAPASEAVKNIISVDLLKRYNVKKIELYVRPEKGETVARKGFQIIGSNDADFADYDILGEIDSNGNDELFPDMGKFTVNLDGTKDYRYIAVKRTENGWYLYSEIKVFADVNVTKVSGNATASSTVETYMDNEAAFGAAKATDQNIGTAWHTKYLLTYHDLTVDLNGQYPIGIFEAVKRASESSCHLSNNTEFYGSNTVVSDEEIVQTKYLTKEQGYTRIAFTKDDYEITSLPEANRNIDKQFIAADSGHYYFTVSVDDRQAFRYLTLKREGSAGNSGATSFAEIMAYAINPQVNGIEAFGKTFTVKFSDVMFPSMLNSDNIVIKDAVTGEVLVQDNISVTDYEYSFTANNAVEGRTYTITVADTLKGLNGVPIASEYSGNIVAPDMVEIEYIMAYDAEGAEHVISSLTAETEYTVKADLISAVATDAVMIIAQKQDDKLVKAFVKDVTLTVGENPVEMQITTGENLGNDVAVYIWQKGTMMPLSRK